MISSRDYWRDGASCIVLHSLWCLWYRNSVQSIRTRWTEDAITYLYHNHPPPSSSQSQYCHSTPSTSSHGGIITRNMEWPTNSTEKDSQTQLDPVPTYTAQLFGGGASGETRLDGQVRWDERRLLEKFCENCERWINLGPSLASEWPFSVHYLSGVCRDKAKKLVKRREREGKTKPRDSRKVIDRRATLVDLI